MPAVDLITLLSQLEESKSFSTVQDIVRQRAHFYGYDKIVFFSTHSTLDGIIERIYWIEGNWFYNENNIDAATYIKHCPITRHIIETNRPFFWTKQPDVNREQYRVVTKPKGSGIHGLQIPIFGHLGLEGAVSLGGETIDSSARARHELTLLSTYAFFAARRLLDSSEPNQLLSLSKREKEVLSWTALGRRQADIAIALGVSHRTVENHLRNARLKLGGATTAETIRIAMQRGDIDSNSV